MVSMMKRRAHAPHRRLGKAWLALLLIAAWVGAVIESSPTQAAGLPGRPGPASIAATPPPEPSLVPAPAKNYALDLTAPGSFPNLGTGLQMEPSETAADGSSNRDQYQASGPEPDIFTVESTVSILGSSPQADQQFDKMLADKRKETGATPQGESGWSTDRISTYQTTNTSGDRTAGAVLRYRNAIGLVEIRGRAQHATAENAKVLMKRMLQAFQRSLQPPDGSGS